MAAHIRAAGAVLWRRARGGPEVAVVHRPRYDDWSLPKGKLDKGETTIAAAAREVAEETGSGCALAGHLGRVEYAVAGVDKVVDYFSARATTGSFEVNDEVDELRWLPPAAAAGLLTYPHDRGVLDRFTALGQDVVTLLLVRHAHAGKKELWDGPDAQRPLSETGKRQTRALTRLLPLFHPSAVHAVPKVRCEATVAPLAGLLGLPVAAEPALAEGAPLRRAVARVRELARAGSAPVVCGQGGVIPDLLAELADGTGVAVDRRCRKGSVWVLSFTRSARLVGAHYAAP
ncbi:NUDIX hydrolase [Actinokineospora bangkokensis]|uniref:NUDIX hydrolase n=1 Tax=Actinokineospora bangkokensis TaxID=1193682 RepID=A0A1Q9LHU9_9PSEU|nr:NUDIX hydrolase [Actinokineospora bangkokensis]OLR91595.1 NUDIX hydrolase [Actinokineospora bangkokensis]